MPRYRFEMRELKDATRERLIEGIEDLSREVEVLTASLTKVKQELDDAERNEYLLEQHCQHLLFGHRPEGVEKLIGKHDPAMCTICDKDVFKSSTSTP